MLVDSEVLAIWRCEGKREGKLSEIEVHVCSGVSVVCGCLTASRYKLQWAAVAVVPRS